MNKRTDTTTLNSLNANSKYNTYLVEFPQVRKTIKKTIKKIVNNLYRNKKGHGALIFIAFLYFIIGYLLIAGPLTQTARNLKFTLIHSQLDSANGIGTALNSPVRNRIVYEVYKGVQSQLISHLQAAAGSNPYLCQGQYTEPTKTDSVTGVTTGDLSYQYGLCSPETLLLGLSGDTNQSLDLISGIYPDYQKTLSTPYNDHIRQSIIKDNQNDYNYTLRTTYVGEDVLSQGASSSTLSNRLERYHYLVRADVEYFTYRYTKLRSPLVIYYDVFITNSFYNSPFYGSGNACDQTTTYTNSCGTDSLGQPVSCVPAMVVNADGSRGFAVQFGQDDPDYRPVNSCISIGLGDIETVQCPLSGGRTSIEFKPRGTKMQTGCASLSTGISGVTSPDPNGYGFVITARTVSYGKPYS